MGKMQAQCRTRRAYCGSQEPQASLPIGCFEFKRNGGNRCLQQVCRTYLFGSMSHFPTMGSWKAGSPASNPRRLKASKSWSSTILHWLSAVAWSQSIACNPKFGYHNSIFCKDDATTMKLVERAAALRDLKLLGGSGGLDFTRGMDSWTYMSNKSLFGSASRSTWVAERLAAFHWLATGFLQNLGDRNCVTKRFASLHETISFFCSCNEGMGKMQAQCRTRRAYCGSQEP